MNQAGKYHSNNFVQARDVEELLQKFKSKIKLDGRKKIIDIGCGPGDVTYNSLFQLISNEAELLGIDISEPMIQFANSHYHDLRLNFETCDALDLKFVEKYATYFDTAFSFYCFQWIQDQRSLLENLYSILKPGGVTLFVQVVDAINYPLYEILGESPKWAPYMKNYKNVIPPYRSSADPVSDIGNLMHDIGFHVNECTLTSRSYTFSSKRAFYDWMEGVNPFSKNIPKHLAKEYEQKWKQIILDKKLYSYHETTDEITITYSALMVFAQKPMNQVVKYHSNNSLQARDVDVLLQKFKSKMKWDGEKKIIDIGSGPGNITYNYLFPLISDDTELLGIDISESMIQFANLHYSDSRLDFETWDILDPKVVEKYAINFDMAFSFYCFHWVQDQRVLIKNLYSILKPGGETLFIQIVDSLNYVPYEILGESSKWSPYMKNYRNAIPPLRSSINPVFDMGKLMQNVGFNIKECSLAPISYTFTSKQAFYNWLEGLNPFSKNIPKHLAKEFKQEWKQIISDKNLYTYHETTNEVSITYLSLTVFAQKPYSASEM